MEKRYETATRCSELLRLSRLPQLDKLMLEMKLIQIKRLLLRDQTLKGCLFPQCGDNAFCDLEALMTELAETEWLEPAGDRVSQKLEEILDVLWAVDRIDASGYGLSFSNHRSSHRWP
jgi:hypothetical protein